MRILAALVAMLATAAAVHLEPNREHRVPPVPGTADRKADERGTPPRACKRRFVVGHSLRERPILLWRLGCGTGVHVMVIGCIHGDECAGAAVVRQLVERGPVEAATLYLIPTLNPDGLALAVRQNGRGVDLNRNFPSAWRASGRRWDPEYSGPHPLSEPETRLAARLLTRLRPSATLWLHQHYGSRPFVRAWGQSTQAARRFARLAALDFQRLPWPAGTAPNWQNHRFPHTASFVVEYPRDAPSVEALTSSARAIRRLATDTSEPAASARAAGPKSD